VTDWADAKTWREAEAIRRSGGVRDLVIEGACIHATVITAGHPVYTRFEILPDSTVSSNCPCYQNLRYDVICPHVVAAGMAVADLTENPCLERRHRIEARIQQNAQRGLHPRPRREANGSPGSIPAAVRLRVPGTWCEDWQGGRVTVAIRILVDGKKHAPERISPDRALAFSQHDAFLLYVLEDFAQSPTCPSTLPLDGASFAELLQEAAGGSLWVEEGNEPLVISPEPIIGVISICLDENTGQLEISHRTEPGSVPVFLSKRHAWVRVGNSLHPLETILPPELHQVYHAPLRLPRTLTFRYLNAILPALENTFIVENTVNPDRFVLTAGDPGFRVHIQGAADRATVSLQAIYGETPFDTSTTPGNYDAAPVADKPLYYLTRNAAAEQRAREHFLAAFDEQPGDNGMIHLHGPDAVLHAMTDAAAAFRRFGWEVRFGDGIASLAQDACWVAPHIIISTAGDADSYRLAIEYTDEHGTPINTDAVETALHNGQAIMANAGRTLLLDAAGLNGLAAALAECIEYRDSTAFVALIHAGFIRSITSAFATARLSAPEPWLRHAASQQDKAGLPVAPVEDTLFRQLRPYQRDGVNWLCFLDHAGYSGILADEMGLGKTVQALAWIRIRRDAARRDGLEPSPAMVVCPTSLIHNWAREVQRFTPDLSCLVVSGSTRHRQERKLREHDLVITSYALLRRDISHYDNICFSTILLDEAQHIKNRATQNAVAAKRLKGRSRLVLTGTPIENSVNDLWSIMDFLMPGYLGTHTSFRIRFEQPITTGSLNADRAMARLRMKMAPFMLRRLKRDVAADLPEKVTQIAGCPMLPAQRRLYNRLLAQYHDNLSDMVEQQGFERVRFSVFSALLRLRQCCCHPALLKSIPGTAETESGKMDLFFELLDEAMDGGHRVLVFSQFVQMLHILRDALRQRGIAFAYLDGSTRDRMAQVDAFNNNPDIPVFLVSLKAGGSGLNLTGANVVIHYDPWWNPAVEDQATDRTHRIGQLRTVYSIKLVTENSIEQKVIELQQRKRTLINATFGNAAAAEPSLSWEDVRELLRPTEETTLKALPLRVDEPRHFT
jgi:superfamily II DNA or RNA helicase